MKNYIGIARDHSGSMGKISRFAARDYNDNISAIREAAIEKYLDTVVSVTEFGVRGYDVNGCIVRSCNGVIHRAAFYSSVTFLRTLDEDKYEVYGQTPMFDAVGDLIEGFEKAPDYSDPNVSFLIIVVTDGQENASKKWNGTSLSRKIKELQATERWTFVFRAPRGATPYLASLGIPEGNIFEWDQTERGVKEASQVNRQAIHQYYTARASGQKSTGRFYSDLSSVTVKDVKSSMKDISSEVVIWPVGKRDDGEWISHFVQRKLPGESYLKGAGFYQLSKAETVQDHKRVMIRDKKSGSVYEGPAARQMLALPDRGSVRLHPGDHGQFEVFVQSTSYNRHLVEGTHVVYWKGFMRAAA